MLPADKLRAAGLSPRFPQGACCSSPEILKSMVTKGVVECVCIYCVAPLLFDSAVQARACLFLSRMVGIDRKSRDEVVKRAKAVHAHRSLCSALQLHSEDSITSDAIVTMLIALLDTESLQKEAAPALAPVLSVMGAQQAENATGSQALARLAAHMAASKAVRAATSAAGSVKSVFAQATTFAEDPETLCHCLTALGAFLKSFSAETKELAGRIGTDALVRTALASLKRHQGRSLVLVIHALRFLLVVLQTVAGSEKECFDNGERNESKDGTPRVASPPCKYSESTSVSVTLFSTSPPRRPNHLQKHGRQN